MPAADWDHLIFLIEEYRDAAEVHSAGGEAEPAEAAEGVAALCVKLLLPVTRPNAGGGS